MKVGVCGGVTNKGYLNSLKTDADYFECNFTSLANASEDDFQSAYKNVKEDSVCVYSANCMFPGDVALVGDNVTDKELLQEYLKRGFERLASLGAKCAVFGSGKARSAPEGFAFDKAYDQLLNLSYVIGDIAKASGCIAVIEPLRKFETNMINTVCDGAKFIKDLNHSAFKLLADSYHMRAENETTESILEHIDLIYHAHIAEAKMGSDEVRRMPDEADEFNIKEFIFALKTAGYNRGVSIEASPRSGDWVKDATIAVKAIKGWIN